jgi:hypothetical protein
LERTSGGFQLTIDKNQLPGECDWVLPFSGPPAVEEKGNIIILKAMPTVMGSWKAVGLV